MAERQLEEVLSKRALDYHVSLRFQPKDMLFQFSFV